MAAHALLKDHKWDNHRGPFLTSQLKYFQNIFQVALTSDGWTSRATQSYVTVTSSYVNENWELVSNTLQTRPLDESHTGIMINIDYLRILGQIIPQIK